jgi:radical SAM superfamily enzyme YgiQ (UPF0313 family)
MKQKTTKKKIILNYLPPSITEYPSSGLSVLKGFLKKNCYDSKIIYWNVLIQDLITSYFLEYSPYKGDTFEYENTYLSPFLSLLSDKFQDNCANNRMVIYLKSVFPKIQFDPNFRNETFKKLKTDILKLIENELKRLEINQVILFGFSSKFHQWIPALIFAEKLKILFPHIKIVVGGFGDKDAAIEALRINKYFDFSVWGEGEYPLLELCNLLTDGDDNLSSVPRLVYRYENTIKFNNKRGRLLDFQNYIFPDYDDFIKLVRESKLDEDKVSLSIDSERGCHWNRCKFCYGNVGYNYRKRSPESICREIDTLIKKYGITKFRFTGNDLVGRDVQHFEALLDNIIDLSKKHEYKFDLFAEIIHKNLNSRIIKKMSIAGFYFVQVGYEAVADELLKKIDKKTDFADNILFLKFASKYGIRVGGANILRGIIGETENDVIESINNLPFLRFFINKNSISFTHNIGQLKVMKGSKFFDMLDDKDKKKWNINPTYYLFPDSLIEENRRFSFFEFGSELENRIAWKWFDNLNSFYEETDFTYTIMENDNTAYYLEYWEGIQLENIAFDEPEYIATLKTANDNVVSLEAIFESLRNKYPNLTRKRLIEMINDLRSSYLLYSNKDFSRIISVIDVNPGN